MAMSDEEPPEPADERPVFPYDLLSPGYGNAYVHLRELLERAEEYRMYGELAALKLNDSRFVTEHEVAEVLTRHGVALDHTVSFWVIACFYLMSRHLESSGVDPKKSKRILTNAAYHTLNRPGIAGGHLV
ncbi:hypothetical protein [Qipengyuania sp. ASV99]|uniref:hypothetical protein n=1 Tax=Qipengyuania sp. ASV99 TaxID=3399681 RepID=UPI003A4C7AAE